VASASGDNGMPVAEGGVRAQQVENFFVAQAAEPLLPSDAVFRDAEALQKGIEMIGEGEDQTT
jgi:hypothetical protein